MEEKFPDYNYYEEYAKRKLEYGEGVDDIMSPVLEQCRKASRSRILNFDGKPVQRTRPMKVLMLGCPRSGSSSTSTALSLLGFRPYGFPERVLSDGHMHAWSDALRAKFRGIGKVWGRNEFDIVTKDYDCIYDVPPILFAEELITAFPEAKVILTYRDVDKWSQSMSNSLFSVFSWPSWKLLSILDPNMCGGWWRQTRLVFGAFCGNNYTNIELHKQAYIEHNRLVEEVCPPERLLKFQVQDGWEPLCEFLDVPKPEAEFPFVAESAMFMRVHELFWHGCLQNSMENVLRVSGAVAATAVAASVWVLYGL